MRSDLSERFSLALAVILTPVVDVMEMMRLLKAAQVSAASGTPISLLSAIGTSMLGNGVFIPRRIAGSEVAKQLARKRPLALVRV